MMTKTKLVRNHTSWVCRKSQAQMAVAWLCKKVPFGQKTSSGRGMSQIVGAFRGRMEGLFFR
jgi:hypothetical protein